MEPASKKGDGQLTANNTTQERVKLNIIAKVAGIGMDTVGPENKERVSLELIESDDKKFTWTNIFHPSEFKALTMGDVYEFAVELLPTKEGKGFHRNLSKVVGPAEMPPKGEMTSFIKKTAGASGQGGSGGGMSTEDRGRERASIESQTSINQVIKLIEAGWSIEEVESNLPKVLELAGRIETHLMAAPQRRGMAVQATPAKTATNGRRASTAKAPACISSVENVGQLLQLVKNTWPEKGKSKLKEQVEETLGMEISHIKDFPDAFAQLEVHWSPQEPEEEAA